MQDPVVSTRNAYREFRGRMIESIEPTRRSHSSYQFDTSRPIEQRRQQIRAFREHLAFYGETILSQDPKLEPMVRAALRIPTDVPLQITRIAKCCLYLIGVLPVPVVVRRAKVLLRRIGTHEGRDFAFMLLIDKTLPGQQYFSPALDYALRELHAPDQLGALSDFRCLEVNWVRACHLLGLQGIDEIARCINAQSRPRVNGALVLALVELGVIDSADALSKLPRRSGWRHGDDQLAQDDLRRFREVVQCLKDAGVAPPGIARLVKLDVRRFDPQQLKVTLSALRLRGPELTRLFDALGDQVVLVNPERWAFLNEALAVSPPDMERFKRLLDSGRTPSKDFAIALRAAGAGVADLEACQSLIMSIGDRKGQAPITELHALINSPHALTFAQLASGEDYLLGERDLVAYLRVLNHNGLGDAQSVLAFQRCYRQFNANTLDRLLCIAGERVKGHPATEIADWIIQAGKAGYADSFDYLLQVDEVRTFTHLKQVLKLAPMGPSLLRYFREERGLKSLSALLKWYRRDALGINDVKLWSDLNNVSRVLLDDAFERKDFTLFEGNLGSIDEVIIQRIEAKIGTFPYSSDESTQEAYNQSSHQLREQIGNDIAPRLRMLLNESSGFLPLSLLDHIDSPLEVVRARLAQLTPDLVKLRTGSGPAGRTLTDLEADLIAMVYRTTSYTVRSHWTDVIGREDDISWHTTSAPYSMSWSRAEQQLDGLLDSRGLQAMHAALQFAVRFNTLRREDMHDACRRLSPKRLWAPAADVWSLALHLGVLLAIAAEDLNVHEWLDQGPAMIERMAEAGPLVHQQIESLHELFDVQLGDALDALESDFVQGLTEADAGDLGSRLDMHSAANVPSARGGLKVALTKARETVLGAFLRWTAQQKRLFDPMVVEGDCTLMQAYVAKSPAAYFAKEAARLCTRSNTAMWRERRNAHLLVFAADQKRLVGMALLYVESVPALDANRDTLIIRAISPMPDALASYGVSSIVDSYFDVAIQIARNYGLAAVAFPTLTGMHLLSNHQTVENDIRDRFMKRAQTHFFRNVDQSSSSWLGQPRKVEAKFYAYESGQTLVNELYAIWHLAENELTAVGS